MKPKFENLKIGVIGASIEGLDSIIYLLANNFDVTILDAKKSKDLSVEINNLLNKGLKSILGPEYLDHLEKFDVIIRTPGISPNNPKIVEARKNGVKITSLTQIFMENCTAKIIGVTGTKGKGTTCSLIAKILEFNGFKVYLGGNIGIPLLSKLDLIKSNDVVVYELSSFQLEDITISPYISVVLKITQDHLLNNDKNSTNYHLTRKDYIDAKKPITLFQNSEDYLIYNKDSDASLEFSKITKAKCFSVSSIDKNSDCFIDFDKVILKLNGSEKKICDLSEIKLIGKHNLENISASVLAVSPFNLNLENVKKAIKEFVGLEHRLELVSEINNIKFINDSFSTVPETTIAAIDSFNEPVCLILGGSEKGSDFDALGKKLSTSTVKCVILIGQMTNRIEEKLIKYKYPGKIIKGLTAMSEIVECAISNLIDNGVVLLSPACASFDMFKNYKERGILFKNEVLKHKK